MPRVADAFRSIHLHTGSAEARAELARNWPRLLPLCLGVILTPACSFSIDPDRVQCEETADCRARGDQFADSVCIASVCQPDPKWACLESPRPPVTTSGQFEIRIPLIDLVSQAKLSGVTASVCKKLDVDCNSPEFTTESDQDGIAIVKVNAGFSGYVQLSAPELVTTLYFFNPPVDRSLNLPNLTLSTSQGRAALLQKLGASPELGDVLVQVTDCTDRPAENVRFKLSPTNEAAIPYYLSSGLPTPGKVSTDNTGYGGYFNVMPGNVTIDAEMTATDRVLDSMGLIVRGGASTWSRLVPRLVQ